MTVQRADNLSLSYYKQTNFGEAPSSPAMQVLRIVNESLKSNKKTVTSKVLGTRQVKEIYKIGENMGGGIKGELAFAEWNWALEGVLGGAFSAVTVTATDISFVASDSSINSAGAGFGSLIAGQWLLISGTSAHDGLWRVASKSSASKLILADGVSSAGATLTVADESAGASMTVKGKVLRQGTTLNSYTLERINSDAGTFDVWNGFTFDEVKLSIKESDLVAIECSGMGKVGDFNNTATIAGSTTAQSANDAYNGTNNVMRLKEGSTVLSDELVSLDLSIKSNLRERLALGNTTPTGMAQGDVEVTGTLEFYHEDNTRRQLFQDHTDTTFFVILKDASSQYFIITMRKFYYQDLNNNAEAKNSDVLEKYSIQASEDGTYSQTIQIDSLS